MFKPHGLVYHSTLDSRVIQRRREEEGGDLWNVLAWVHVLEMLLEPVWGVTRYRGTSLIRNRPPPRTTIWL